MNYHVRWLIRKDMEQVLDIERASFLSPLSYDNIITFLSKPECIGIAILDNNDHTLVVGYAIYLLYDDHAHLVRLVVHPDARRRNAGTELLNYAKRVLKRNRVRLTMMVPEVSEFGDFGHLLFMKNNGFIASRVSRGEFEDVDGYFMEFMKDELAKI